TPDAVVDLAHFVKSIDFTRLSDDARWAMRVELLDTVACTLGGRQTLDVSQLTAVAGGPREHNSASDWSSGIRYAAPDAALINGTVGHALEFDDTHDSGALHVGVTVIPAAVGAAESIGATGTDLLSGMVSG